MVKRCWFVRTENTWNTAQDLHVLADQMRYGKDVHAEWHEVETAATAIDDLLSENEDLGEEIKELQKLVDKLEGATPKPPDRTSEIPCEIPS